MEEDNHKKHKKTKNNSALRWVSSDEILKEFKFPNKIKNHIQISTMRKNESANFLFSKAQKIFLLLFFSILTFFLILNWRYTAQILVIIITIIYFLDLLFNFFLICRSFVKKGIIKISPEEIKQIDENLPVYTVLCPVYKEGAVLGQFISAMTRLNYPKEKLQILLILEDDDIETITQIGKMSLPNFFEIVTVPNSLPKTKPKAMNYALPRARGEYCVIYDAEDVPDPLQLKKSVAAFSKINPNIICLQAKLNFYNPHQNILTRVFTAEYSLWFDLILTGLQSIQAPIPLGGTSNHFRTKDLSNLGGWDPFNVTEDADLGMRLFKRGYRTGILESVTLEEANSDVANWLQQRTRWIKGYIQTYIVHMRNPSDFITTWKNPHILTFQVILGTKVLSMLINPIMWIITVSYFVFRNQIGPTIEGFYPAPLLYPAVFTLVFGNFVQIVYYMLGCYKRRYYDLCKYAFIVPLYWLAISIAAWKSVYETIVRPHHWAKTKHGLHLKNDNSLAQSEKNIGNNLVDQRIYT